MSTDTTATRQPTSAELILLAAKADRRNTLKEQVAAVTEAIANLDAEIIADLKAAGLEQVDGILTKGVTLVSPVAKPGWDDKILEQVVSPTVWRRITKRVLDRTLLDAELLVGRIKSDDLAAAVIPPKPIAEYLKVR